MSDVQPHSDEMLVRVQRENFSIDQELDRVKRRQDRAFLPGRQIGGVFAGEHESAVDLAEIVVMLLSVRVGPAGLAEEDQQLEFKIGQHLVAVHVRRLEDGPAQLHEFGHAEPAVLVLVRRGEGIAAQAAATVLLPFDLPGAAG